jgi:hypothetical protein
MFLLAGFSNGDLFPSAQILVAAPLENEVNPLGQINYFRFATTTRLDLTVVISDQRSP